jgi:CheY-like chemotaxis protein
MTSERSQPTTGSASSEAVHQIVIVDAACESYRDFVQAAQRGSIGLHFCVDGRSAVRLARGFRADAWLIALDLPDMSGFDLLESLAPHVLQSSVDPLRGGARISLERVGDTAHSGIFIVADSYRIDEERLALASGVAGYLVRPVTFESMVQNTAVLNRTSRGSASRGSSSRGSASPDSGPCDAAEGNSSLGSLPVSSGVASRSERSHS